MTTTNGTRAILASLEAERVYIASFANLQATSDEISVQFLKKDHGHPVHIVCAGTEGYISLEDSLLAGALTSRITRAEPPPSTPRPSAFGNDEALIVLSQWLEVERYLEQRPLVEIAEPGPRRPECATDRPGCRYRGRRRVRPLQPGRRAEPRPVANRGCLIW